MEKEARILIVDNEKLYQRIIEGILLCEDYAFKMVNNGEEALNLIKRGFVFDVVILDIMMRTDTEGVETLILIKKLSPLTQIIMLTVKDDLDLAVELVNKGAYFYFVKERLDIYKFREKVAECVQLVKKAASYNDEEIINNSFREHFFSPIASTFKIYQSTTSSEYKLQHLFKLFENIIKFKTILIVTEYVKYFKLSLNINFIIDLKAQKPQITSWLDILINLFTLRDSIKAKNGIRFDRFLQNDSIKDLIKSIAKDYEDYIMDDNKKIMRINNKIIEKNNILLMILIKEISYLNNYILSQVIKKPEKVDGSYDYGLKEYHGSKPNPELVKKNYSISLPENELVIIDTFSNYFLSLHPLLITKICGGCKLEQIFYFSHIENESAVFCCFNCNHQFITSEFNVILQEEFNFNFEKLK